jgi:hypothetical protein
MFNFPPQFGHDRVMKSEELAFGSGGTCTVFAGLNGGGVTMPAGVFGKAVSGNLLPQETQNTASRALGVPHFGQYF